jgi:hypothetical protein
MYQHCKCARIRKVSTYRLANTGHRRLILTALVGLCGVKVGFHKKDLDNSLQDKCKYDSLYLGKAYQH